MNSTDFFECCCRFSVLTESSSIWFNIHIKFSWICCKRISSRRCFFHLANTYGISKVFKSFNSNTFGKRLRGVIHDCISFIHSWDVRVIFSIPCNSFVIFSSYCSVWRKGSLPEIRLIIDISVSNIISSICKFINVVKCDYTYFIFARFISTPC